MECASCGHELRPKAKFCDECGARVRGTEAAERKLVTVLFCDVVGSMTLAATLDPERLREVMHELFNRSARVVQRYEGTVDKFTGDGLMAIFGAPIALEDHAARAAFASFEIHAAAARLAEDVARRDGIDLLLRIGLNSGDVVAGDIGSDYTAIGHSVGMAQRMEAAAPQGGTLCSQTTAALLEDVAELGDVQWVAVKNQAEPVAARQLLGMVDEHRPAARARGPMHGRHDELDQLLAAHEESHQRGLVVEVVGSAGIGKSRLIREFCSTAESSGVKVVTARCESHTADVPLRALGRLLRALGIAEPDAAATPDVARRRVLEDLAGALTALPAGAVLVLEDVHWIDEASAEVLIDLYPDVAATRSLLLVSLRPEYQGKLRGNGDQTVTLRPLPDAGARAMAGELIGSDPSVDGVPDLVATAAAGNPFFVEEIVRDLVSRGVLTGTRGAHHLVGRLGDITVPATVQAALSARIDRLSASSKTLLNAAAVIGMRFGLDTLALLVPGTEPAALSELVAGELIDQVELLPQRTYAFRHPLVRTVAYESQLNSARGVAHRRLADALQQRHADALDEHAAAIAAQYEAAGALDEAYEWHMRAANWLRTRSMFAARLSWLKARRMADALPNGPQTLAKRVAARTLLARAAYLTTVDDASANYAELLALTEESGDVLSRAVGMAGHVVFLSQAPNGLPAALDMSYELVDVLDRIDGQDTLKYLIYQAIVWVQVIAGRFADALGNAAKQSALDPTPDPYMRAFSIASLGVLGFMSGDRRDGRAYLTEATEVLTAQADAIGRAQITSYWGALTAFGLVDPHEVLPLARLAVQEADAFGDGFGQACARYALGTVLSRTGDDDVRATELLTQAQAHIAKHGNPSIFVPAIEAELAALMARAGELDRGIDAARTAFGSHFEWYGPYYASITAVTLVTLLISRGTAADLRDAESVIVETENAWVELADTAMMVPNLRCRAHVARVRGQGYTEAARAYLEAAERFDAQGMLPEARRMAAETT